MDATALGGFIAAVLSSTIAIPQVVKVARSNNIAGVSAGTSVIAFLNAVCWAVWAILVGEFAPAVPSLVNGPLALFTLWRIWRVHHAERLAEAAADVATEADAIAPADTPLPIAA